MNHIIIFSLDILNTPLLIVNSSEIDFVKSNNDFDELFNQIFREDRGFIEYFKPESKRII